MLSANFRSAEPVIRWVNHVFGRLIEFQPDAQPAYLPLDACRPHHLEHGSVRLLGVEPHHDLATQRSNADELRAREATEVAEAVATALHERWLVVDDDSHERRECRPGDITILLPARTSLPALEAALVERDIPYRAENSSVVYTTADIRHLMLALRAADDPTDELALVAALRTGAVRLQRRRAVRVAARRRLAGRSGATRPPSSPTTRSPRRSPTSARWPNARPGARRPI